MNGVPDGGARPELLRQLGQITRQLHEALQQLGVMPKLQQSAEGLPDARRRLDYITHKSGDAAQRVLGAVEQAKHEQRLLQAAARELLQHDGAWPAARVRDFAASVEAASARVDQQLTDIMLAQDFHDLTGQVVAKLVTLVVDLDDSLRQLQVHAAAREASVAPGADVLHSQHEVDELLAQLGV
ncbi:MAG TPA: protein phosphatase CheZ [Rubrivivax sp.]|nr:protein phosphatase CheZ [Rubrivivax sp.]